MSQPIKKSFNVNPDIAQRVDDIIQQNPGLSFTFIMNKALEAWLRNPTLTVQARAYTGDDVDRFMAENSELMDKLSK